MTVRAMDRVGAEDVAVGQVWACPPGLGGHGRASHRDRYLAVEVDGDAATATVVAESGPQRPLVVSFGTLLSDWTLAREAP